MTSNVDCFKAGIYATKKDLEQQLMEINQQSDRDTEIFIATYRLDSKNFEHMKAITQFKELLEIKYMPKKELLENSICKLDSMLK